MRASTDHVRAVARSFDERAGTYDESRMHRDLARAAADFAVGHTHEGPSAVLDVATGTGLMLRALDARTPGAALFGVDVSPGMLDVARRQLPQARLTVADASETGLPESSVDLVTCVTALHLLEDPDAAFAEWHRVLRHGGRVVTATFAENAVVATPQRDYVRNHAPFATPELLAVAAGERFELTRHDLWTDGTDRVLLAELVSR